MMAEQPFTTTAEDADPRAELADASTTVRFMLAGDAHVTFQSRKTGTRFTYRITQASAERRPSLYFVAVLTAPDHYEYIGCIYERRTYSHGRKSRIDREAPSAVAFAWVWPKLTAGELHPELAVYHEGRCGACGRRLTTPESIASGLGPVCAGRQR
jgi:hypothetical protein